MTQTDAPSGVLARTTDLAGRAIGAITTVVGKVRPADKPLHPRGAVSRGVLDRTGAVPPTGVAWLDATGSDDVLVRVSRGGGLPGPLPDVQGVAVRVSAENPADLLMNSSGSGRLTRFGIWPSRSVDGSALSAVMPYRSPDGRSFVIGADAEVADDRLVLRLRVATPRGPWRHFGLVTVDRARLADDAGISFDPIANPLPGLTPPPWVARLRRYSYRAARRTRGEAG